MRFQDLDQYWKKIFELEWISLCEGSKAIAVLIVSNLLSMYLWRMIKNRIGEVGNVL